VKAHCERAMQSADPPSPQESIMESNGVAENHGPSTDIKDTSSYPLAIPQRQSIYDMLMSHHELTSNQYSHTVALHRPVTMDNPTSSDDPCSLDQITRRSLPYFLPWQMTASPNQVPPDFGWMANSCGGKAAIGVFGGGVMGLLMGVFLGAMSDATPPVQFIAGKEVPQAPLREQMKLTLRATANKSMYWCKNFAFITGVFGGSECLVEKYRGKHDVWNSVVSGCLTGAALQAKSGPQAAAVGCGGFAAFSLVIDSVMGHY
jgi:mitochondrial import inner membrane translocase subunit TIM22